MENNQPNSIYVSKLENFLEDEKIMNEKYETLQFKNRNKSENKLCGHFTRVTNYILDSLNLAKISFSEYKLFMFFYRRTIGNSVRTLDLEYLMEMSESAGLSYSSFTRALKSLKDKKMIILGTRKFRRFDKDIEVNSVKIETFPDKWVDVGSKVKKYIDEWISNRKQDIGYVKLVKSGKAPQKTGFAGFRIEEHK